MPCHPHSITPYLLPTRLSLSHPTSPRLECIAKLRSELRTDAVWPRPLTAGAALRVSCVQALQTMLAPPGALSASLTELDISGGLHLPDAALHAIGQLPALTSLCMAGRFGWSPATFGKAGAHLPAPCTHICSSHQCP